MFGHPATIHNPRTYSHNPTTTGRRKLTINDENHGSQLPSKTPSRPGLTGRTGGKEQLLAPSTAVRLGLGAKTEDRNRILGGGNREGGGKGKGKEEEIEPKRLFASGSTTVQPSKSLSNLAPIHSKPTQQSQVFGKTPLRQPLKTPARPPPTSRKPLNTLRTPAPSFRIPLDTAPPLPLQDIQSTPLPSSTRRRRSKSSNSNGSISSLTPIKRNELSDPGFSYQTPAPLRWEEENSLDSINEIAELGADGNVGIELDVLGEVEEESDGEVEYMPPKLQELPYEPSWGPGPDLEAAMKGIASLPSLWSPYDSAIRLTTPEYKPSDITGTFQINLIPDEELEDPIFRKAPTKINPRPAPSSIKGQSRPPVPSSSRPIKTIIPHKQTSASIARAGLPRINQSYNKTKSTSTVVRKPRPPIPNSPRPEPVSNNMEGERQEEKEVENLGLGLDDINFDFDHEELNLEII